MNSFNHYSLGSVGEWLYGHVAGISTDPDYPGFKRIVIAPHPGPGLTFANASYDSVHGRIVSNWKREAGAFTLDISIPPNTSATVRFPAQDGNRVLESGQSAMQAPDVKFLRQDGNRAVFSVGSGTYKFTVAAQ